MGQIGRGHYGHRARLAREHGCHDCANGCRPGSHRRASFERNGWCPRWTYRNATDMALHELAMAMHRSGRTSPVGATRADGEVRAWPTATAAANDLGVSTSCVSVCAKRHAAIDGWKLRYI